MTSRRKQIWATFQSPGSIIFDTFERPGVPFIVCTLPGYGRVIPADIPALAPRIPLCHFLRLPVGVHSGMDIRYWTRESVG